MTPKQRVLAALEDLPDNATAEEVLERVLLLIKIERGILQADAGQTISHEQVGMRMMNRWG